MTTRRATMHQSEFEWRVNPLLSFARPAIQEALNGIVSEQPPIPNESDIVIQSMLSLCRYRAEQLWQGDNNSLQTTVDSIRLGPRATAGAQAITDNMARLTINQELVAKTVQAHYHYQQDREHTQIGKLLTDITSVHTNPFGSGETMTTTRSRTFEGYACGRKMHVREKNTDKRITMRLVDPSLSKIYAESLHYIHKAREDEVISFGAYEENRDLPFAWVSYSPVGTEGERIIAQQSGLRPANTLEMTRAWNTSWSPKNTMSVLFAFAHNQLQALSRTEGVNGIPDDIDGIVTAINPNLGFSGMAFSGVGFGIVGLKETNHKFLIDSRYNTPIYMLKRDIARVLGVSALDLAEHSQYAESNLPLLPTNVMAVKFNGKSRQKPNAPIVIA